MEPKVKVEYTFGPDIDLRKTILRDKNGRRITNRRAEKMANEAIEALIKRQQLSDESVKSSQAKPRLSAKLRKLLKRKG